MQQQWLWPGVGLCLGLAGIFAGMQKSAADAGAGSLSNEVSAQLAELSSGLERMAQENRALRAEVDALRGEGGGASLAGASRLSATTPEQSFERWIEEHPEEISALLARADLGGAAAAAERELTPEERAERVADFVGRIFDDPNSWDDREALWEQVREAGLLDEVVARMEERSELDPNNPESHVQLGEAYLQKVFEAGNGPAAGQWAMKADGAYDAALALDDAHWGARYSKAVSLSFWPPVFGKQAEAVTHFETLIGQQESHGDYQEGYETTYLWLGNLYEQLGQPDKAQQTWSQGALLYPEFGDLADKLALAQGAGN